MYCPNCGESQEQTANFCMACGTRLGRKAAGQASPAKAPDTAQVPPADGAGDPPQPVKVLDAGTRVLFSGARAEDVQRALDKYVADGSHVVTALCQVGKIWTAACTIPPRKERMDDTQSLSLAEVKQASATRAEFEDPEFAHDGCRVEEAGFKRLVYGPSKAAVQRRYEHMKQFGAQLVGEIEETDGEWVAVCDTGGATTSFKW
jgi:hypothetical protein